MDSRNYTDVIIAGKVYTLGGYESEEYLQRIAGYLNGKNSELRKIDGFLRQTPDYQNILMQLNVADDYFKAAEELAEVNRRGTGKRAVCTEAPACYGSDEAGKAPQ